MFEGVSLSAFLSLQITFTVGFIFSEDLRSL